MARAMKDSGIEWIGEIPESWDVIAFWQAITRMGTGLNPRENFELSKDDPLYYVTIRNFKDGKLYLDDNCDRISHLAWSIIQERSDLHTGDILFASISKDGQAYIIEQEPTNWNINESVFCIRVDPQLFYEKYFYYHLINKGYYDDLRMDATGSTFQSIKQNKLRKSRLVIPPLSEQHIIANHLDAECTRIDAVIEQTRASIEEYKKLKQSVITQAVTKGIRPGRRMVNSGVDWIGQIPDEWAVFRIANLYDERNERGTDDLPILTVSINTGISDHEIPDEEKDRVVVRSEDRTLYKRVCPGDLAYNMMRAWQGAFGAARVDGMVSPAYVVAKPKMPGILDSRYVEALLRTPSAIEEMHRYSRGITDFRLRLYWPEFKNICVCVPSIKEQIEIADYIDAKAAEIDALIQKKQQFLVELESYKKALIFEYVTGKKEVYN